MLDVIYDTFRIWIHLILLPVAYFVDTILIFFIRFLYLRIT